LWSFLTDWVTIDEVGTGSVAGPVLLSYNNYINETTMSSNSSSSSSGIGFPGLLTVLFIGLKLTGHITWPWVWVMSPLWISALLAITILGFAFIIPFLQQK